jgi:hypothetical protein
MGLILHDAVAKGGGLRPKMIGKESAHLERPDRLSGGPDVTF